MSHNRQAIVRVQLTADAASECFEKYRNWGAILARGVIAHSFLSFLRCPIFGLVGRTGVIEDLEGFSEELVTWGYWKGQAFVVVDINGVFGRAECIWNRCES